MQKELINYFVDKVKEIQPSNMQLRDIEVIYSIGKIKSQMHSASDKGKESRYCADALWDIVL